MQNSQTAQELFAGSIGGITQVFAGQPFDTVKVRLQTQSHLYNGVTDVVKQILSKEGILGFYKGTLTPLLGVGACVSIQFGTLEYMKRFFMTQNNNNSQLSMGQLFLAGAASGIANSVLSGPIEHVRTRLQVQSGASGEFKGPWDFVKQIGSKYGIAGIYKGQMITLAREFSGYGIYFMTYEALMQKTMKDENKSRQQIETWKQMMFGAISGYSLWLIIYPIDSVKSKIQTDGFDLKTQKYTGSLDCARKTIAAEGIRGLYKGFIPCMLRAGPANAATFTTNSRNDQQEPNERSLLLGESIISNLSALNHEPSQKLLLQQQQQLQEVTNNKYNEIVKRTAEQMIDISSIRMMDRLQPEDAIQRAAEYNTLLRDIKISNVVETANITPNENVNNDEKNSSTIDEICNAHCKISPGQSLDHLLMTFT